MIIVVVGIVLLVATAAGVGFSWGLGRGEDERGVLAEELCRARLRARVLEQELERRAGVDVLAWSALAKGNNAALCTNCQSEDSCTALPDEECEMMPAVETTGAHEFGEWLRERIADTDRFMEALDEEIPSVENLPRPVLPGRTRGEWLPGQTRPGQGNGQGPVPRGTLVSETRPTPPPPEPAPDGPAAAPTRR